MAIPSVVDDFELRRRQQETRNEVVINYVRGALILFAFCAHMLPHIMANAPLRTNLPTDVLLGLFNVVNVIVFFYLRADPPYYAWRKYALSASEVLVCVCIFRMQRDVMPAVIYGLAPVTVMALLLIVSAMRYSTGVVIMTGLLGVACQEYFFASTLDSVLRPMAMGSNAVLLTLSTILLAYVVRSLLTFQRDAVMKERLARFLAPEMVDEIAAHPELLEKAVETREATVLFTDIRGFSSLSENMDAVQVVAFLNDFLEEMTEAVMAHGGMLDKYIGDCVMAVFGVPDGRSDHALRAVRAALDMKVRLVAVNARAQRLGQPQLGFGVGIHTGPLVVGAIGSSRRLDYTVIGDTVNVAARLETLTRLHPTDILLSEATREHLGGAIELREMGTVPVKGRVEPVHIYAPLEALLPEPPVAAVNAATD